MRGLTKREIKDMIGVECPEIYDGVLYWFDRKTGTAYAREGFIEEFYDIFPNASTNEEGIVCALSRHLIGV